MSMPQLQGVHCNFWPIPNSLIEGSRFRLIRPSSWGWYPEHPVQARSCTCSKRKTSKDIERLLLQTARIQQQTTGILGHSPWPNGCQQSTDQHKSRAEVECSEYKRLKVLNPKLFMGRKLVQLRLHFGSHEFSQLAPRS